MSLPGSYKINFTNPARISKQLVEGSFTIEPFTVDGRVNPNSSVQAPGSSSTNTSLLLVGKGNPSYGDTINENFVHLLENFASNINPVAPIHGQVWFDTGHAFTIVAEDIENDVFTIAGDHVQTILDIIAEDQLVGVPPEVNPKGVLRFVNTEQQTTFIGRPELVVVGSPATGYPSLNSSGNTEIKLLDNTFSSNGIISLFLEEHYATVPSNRNTLRVWDDGLDQGTTPAWVSLNSAYCGDEAPDSPDNGELWVDTSVSPSILRYYDGNTFSGGFLSLSGGTLTGKLVLDGSTPTAAEDATSKKYVDDEINDAFSGFLPLTGGTMTGNLVLDGSTPTNDEDAASKKYVDDEIVTGLGTLVDDVTSLNTAVSGKYNVTGGTLTGDVSFNIPQSSTSAGVRFLGTGGQAGHNLKLNSEGISATTIKHRLRMETPSGATAKNSALTFDVKPDSAAATEVFELRKEAVFAPVGIYEIDPATVTLGATPLASAKYLTKAEYDTEIASIGNIMTDSATWNPSTTVLTINGLTGNIPINLSHTHTGLDDVTVGVDQLDERESLPGIFPNADDSVVTTAVAVRALDGIKVDSTNAIIESTVKNVHTSATLTADVTSNTFTISTTDLADTGISSGDKISFQRAATTATAVLNYGGTVSGGDNTGLANDATTYEAGISLDSNILIQLSIAGSSAQKFQDLLSQINLAMAPYATVVISSGDLLFQTTRADSFASVSISDIGLFSNTIGYVGLGAEVAGTSAETTADNITVASVFSSGGGSPIITVTTVEDLDGGLGLVNDDLELYRTATIATDSRDLITKKYLDEYSGRPRIIVSFNGNTGAINASAPNVNVLSVSQDATGLYTITADVISVGINDFLVQAPIVTGLVYSDPYADGRDNMFIRESSSASRTATTIQIATPENGANTLRDEDIVNVVIY